MGDAGSFNRQNRTLYIGRIKETGNGQEAKEVVTRHFREWGTIERILQYRCFHAQFAKEAMACQSLDNDEILNVRWATEPQTDRGHNESCALEDGVMVGYIEEEDEPESKHRGLNSKSGDVHSETPSPPAGLLNHRYFGRFEIFRKIRSQHGLPPAQQRLGDYGSDEDD
ncbi:hypothetical protein BYT27DRAFT_7225014 [Phlegmacium glaucopus]|nr:hypothetical protein BYT27DRAFT_7225014 [Phlegmacium glaucopus]